VYLQIFPINYAYKNFFLRPGGADAPTALLGYAYVCKIFRLKLVWILAEPAGVGQYDSVTRPKPKVAVCYCGVYPGEVRGASSLWPLAIGVVVVVVIMAVALSVVYRSRKTRRSHTILRQCSQTSHVTLCTQLSVTGNGFPMNSETLRSTRRTALTAGASTDFTDGTYVISNLHRPNLWRHYGGRRTALGDTIQGVTHI